MARSYRFLDNKGQPTIEVKGLPPAPLRDLYHHVLTMRWRTFLLMIFVAYLTVNAFFGALYWLDVGAFRMSGLARIPTRTSSASKR